MMKLNLITQFFITLMLIILLIILTNLIHPIYLILLILIFTIKICNIISSKNSNYLLSIMMFFIMISGLMIIFLYFASLISNEQMKLNFFFSPSFFNINMYFNIILLTFLMLMYFKFDSLNYSEINYLSLINQKFSINIKSIYMNPFNHLTLLSIFFLLISLLMIIKICSLKSSSLRKLN